MLILCPSCRKPNAVKSSSLTDAGLEVSCVACQAELLVDPQGVARVLAAPTPTIAPEPAPAPAVVPQAEATILEPAADSAIAPTSLATLPPPGPVIDDLEESIAALAAIDSAIAEAYAANKAAASAEKDGGSAPPAVAEPSATAKAQGARPTAKPVAKPVAKPAPVALPVAMPARPKKGKKRGSGRAGSSQSAKGQGGAKPAASPSPAKSTAKPVAAAKPAASAEPAAVPVQSGASQTDWQPVIFDATLETTLPPGAGGTQVTVHAQASAPEAEPSTVSSDDGLGAYAPLIAPSPELFLYAGPFRRPPASPEDIAASRQRLDDYLSQAMDAIDTWGSERPLATSITQLPTSGGVSEGMFDATAEAELMPTEASRASSTLAEIARAYPPEWLMTVAEINAKNDALVFPRRRRWLRRPWVLATMTLALVAMSLLWASLGQSTDPGDAMDQAVAVRGTAGGGRLTRTRSAVLSLASEHFARGNLYMREKRVSEAINEYKKSVAMNPRHGDAYRALGEAYLLAGRTQKALWAYQQYFQLEPNAADADRIRIMLGNTPSTSP